MFQSIMLAGGRRTPFADFGKSFRDVPITELGVHASKATMAAAGVDPGAVDAITFGNVMPVDYDAPFLSRRIGLGAGLAVGSTAMAVNRACASGSEAIATAARLILSGDSRLALACGAENFSRVPYVSQAMRWGAKRGPSPMEDGLEHAYRCGFSREFMGETAENLADIDGETRERMDEWGLMSQQRARRAIEDGALTRQIAPIEVPDGRGRSLMERDEFPRFDVTAAKLAALKPAFRKDGRVTAGSSSGVTDGAAAILVGSEAAFRDHGVAPEARLVAAAVAGVPPRIMGAGPVPAIRLLLERQGLRVEDIDYFEINEAFAAVNLYAERHLGIPRDRHNLYGGGISIGHPPGATGVRLTIMAIDHLRRTGGRRAVVSMCAGGGQGMATLIEVA